jgi:hypothetical protein
MMRVRARTQVRAAAAEWLTASSSRKNTPRVGSGGVPPDVVVPQLQLPVFASPFASERCSAEGGPGSGAGEGGAPPAESAGGGDTSKGWSSVSAAAGMPIADNVAGLQEQVVTLQVGC